MTRYSVCHHTCFVSCIYDFYMQNLKKAYDLLDLDILYSILVHSRETGF